MNVHQGWIIPQTKLEKLLMPNKKLVAMRPYGLGGTYVFTTTKVSDELTTYAGQLCALKSYCVIADYWFTKLWMAPARLFIKYRAITIHRFKPYKI